MSVTATMLSLLHVFAVFLSLSVLLSHSPFVSLFLPFVLSLIFSIFLWTLSPLFFSVPFNHSLSICLFLCQSLDNFSLLLFHVSQRFYIFSIYRSIYRSIYLSIYLSFAVLKSFSISTVCTFSGGSIDDILCTPI